jgi:hypothetical protein
MIVSQINFAKLQANFGVEPPDSIKAEGFKFERYTWVNYKLSEFSYCCPFYRQMARELALLLS